MVFQLHTVDQQRNIRPILILDEAQVSTPHGGLATLPLLIMIILTIRFQLHTVDQQHSLIYLLKFSTIKFQLHTVDQQLGRQETKTKTSCKFQLHTVDQQPPHYKPPRTRACFNSTRWISNPPEQGMSHLSGTLFQLHTVDQQQLAFLCLRVCLPLLFQLHTVDQQHTG